VTLLNVSIRPAVNGYILVATFSANLTAPNLLGLAIQSAPATEILFVDLPSIGAWLTAQEFVPLAAVAVPTT
jgi:hypothetical protein